MLKCEKCGIEHAEGKPHEHKGKLYIHEEKAICESCLVDLGIPVTCAQTHETYLKLQNELKKGGANFA